MDRVVSASAMPDARERPAAPRDAADAPAHSERVARDRATTIATEYTTTPPAATAALACTGPARKTASSSWLADSTKIEQKVRNAGSASGPRGSAK